MIELHRPVRISYRRPMLCSIAVHAGVVICIAIALKLQSRAIKAQEDAVIAMLQEKEEQAIAEEIEGEKKFARATAKQELLEQLSSVLNDDLESDTLKQLMEQLEADLEALFADNVDVSDPAVFGEMRRVLIEGLEAKSEALLAEALVREIRKHIKDELAPQLSREMERSLKEPGGAILDRAIREFAKKREAEDAEDVIVQSARDPLHQKLADEIEASIKRDLVPPAAEKVLDKFSREIRAFNLDSDRLLPLIEKDITEAVKEEMLNANQNQKIATLRAEVRLKIADDSSLGKRRKELENQIATAEALRQQQEELVKAIDETSPDALNKSGEQIQQLKELYEETAETLHRAELQTTTWMIRAISSARRMAEAKQAVRANESARASLQVDRTVPARRHAKYAKVQIDKLVSQMKAANNALKAEQGKRKERETPAEATPEQAELAKDMTRKLQPDVEAISKASSQAAAKNMRVGDVLGDPDDELLAAIELAQKIENAKKKLKAGRELSSGDLASEMESLMTGGEDGAGDAEQAGSKSGKGEAGKTERAAGRGGVSPHNLAQRKLNREAYQAFVKDLKQRSKLGNAYQNPERVDDPITTARRSSDPSYARLYISADQKKEAERLNKLEASGERTLIKPPFKSLAFGAASMKTDAIRIDGDLSDWGDLVHPMRMKFYANDATTPFEGGIPLHMKWSNRGLYFCYRMPGTHVPVKPSRWAPYNGDVFEIWLDVRNSRDLEMKSSQTSHQFILCPFGLRDSKGTLTEYGRGSRGLIEGKVYVDETESLGICRAKRDATGYTVEAVVFLDALAKPVLTPGMIIGANFSINRQTFAGRNAVQWSASKAIGTHSKPDTWGDIVLLGTDATLRFIDPDNANKAPGHVAVGDVIAVEVTDPDMNILSNSRDRVAVKLSGQQSGQTTLLILEETSRDSGVFRGRCNSQPAFKRARKMRIGLRNGDVLLATYMDARAAYGESNVKIQRAQAIASPILSQKQ